MSRPQSSARGHFTATDSRAKRKCTYCESIFHDEKQCPEKVYYHDEYQDEENYYNITLFESNLVTEQDFRVFVAEASVSAVLDSGATATVAGESWVQNYIVGLSS